MTRWGLPATVAMQSRIVNDRNARSPCNFREEEKFALHTQIDLHKAVDEREAENGMLQLFANSTSAQKLLHKRRNSAISSREMWKNTHNPKH